jgi:hypothetical protein
MMARSRSGFAAFGAALARPLDSVAQRGATELVAAGVLLASVLWGVLPASAEATFPGKNGLFAFGMVEEYAPLEDDDVTEDAYIGVVTRDGRKRRKLVDGGSPAFGPGGTTLAASGGRRRGIVLRRLDGTYVRRLTHGYDTGPTWAPSGRRLAFTRGSGSNFYELRFGRSQKIYTVGRDGGQPALLVSGGEDPAWSSRGEIAFVAGHYSEASDACETVDLSSAPPPPTVLAINARGGSARTVACDGFSPDWSPSGDRLVFVRFGGPFDPLRNKLFTVDRDGTGLRRIYRGRSNLLSPTWSPDGRTIAFLEENKVRVVPANGGSAQTMFRLPVRHLDCDFCEWWLVRPEYLAWQPRRGG